MRTIEWLQCVCCIISLLIGGECCNIEKWFYLFAGSSRFVELKEKSFVELKEFWRRLLKRVSIDCLISKQKKTKKNKGCCAAGHFLIKEVVINNWNWQVFYFRSFFFFEWKKLSGLRLESWMMFGFNRDQNYDFWRVVFYCVSIQCSK